MTDGPAGDRVTARFEAVVDAAGGADRPDWLATAVTDERVRDRLAALAGTVAGRDDAAPGTAYGATLADDERADAGQFATHPGIATALCRWAITPVDDGRLPRVLDPATGAGVFTLAAADRLAALAPDAAPPARRDRIVGVDADPVALALTVHRLLDRADAVAEPHLYEADFFDARPSTPTDAPDESVADTDDALSLGRFDAVVGNPPYVRQEAVDTDRARAHLDAFGPDGETPYRDGDRALSRRSDAYVYFVTHATQFLRPGGRLGVVVPAKWLTTRYGGPFQRFLFHHYRLHGVVGFGARAFDDALVDTVLLLAERCPDPDRRRATPVRFCRLDEQVTADGLLATLDDVGVPTADGTTPDDPFAVTRSDAGRTVTVRQGRLADGESAKLAPYLDAAVPFLGLLSADALVPLGDLGTVKRGVMTGANDFFFLDADGWAAEVDDRFLTPAIKSIRDLDGRRVAAADTDRSLLTVHDYVAAVADETGADGAALASAVIDALDRDGYDGLRAYLDRGRERGFHERRSCRAREVWFDLGPCPAPTVFVPKFFDEDVLAVANPDGLLASNAVDCLWTDADPRVLLGVLNATVTAGLLEAWGRSEGGGALQVMTYELRTLPVPDPRTFAPETRAAVREAADALLAGDEDARRRLDALVLDAIDADLSVERCRDCRERMVERRRETGRRSVSPIVTE